jgi:hypothetical protein
MRYRAYLEGVTATVKGEPEEVELEWTEFAAVDDADAWARAKNITVSQGGAVKWLVERRGHGLPDRSVLSTTDPQVADREETKEG